MEKDSRIPIYIAILMAVILVAAAGYFVLGSDTRSDRDIKEKNLWDSTVSSYYFVVRGNNGLNIENGVTIELSDISEKTEIRINSLENELQKLRSKCDVISYETLNGIQGGTVAYSVTVKGTCNPN